MTVKVRIDGISKDARATTIDICGHRVQGPVQVLNHVELNHARRVSDTISKTMLASAVIDLSPKDVRESGEDPDIHKKVVKRFSTIRPRVQAPLIGVPRFSREVLKQQSLQAEDLQTLVDIQIEAGINVISIVDTPRQGLDGWKPAMSKGLQYAVKNMSERGHASMVIVDAQQRKALLEQKVGWIVEQGSSVDLIGIRCDGNNITALRNILSCLPSDASQAIFLIDTPETLAHVPVSNLHLHGLRGVDLISNYKHKGMPRSDKSDSSEDTTRFAVPRFEFITTLEPSQERAERKIRTRLRRWSQLFDRESLGILDKSSYTEIAGVAASKEMLHDFERLESLPLKDVRGYRIMKNIERGLDELRVEYDAIRKHETFGYLNSKKLVKAIPNRNSVLPSLETQEGPLDRFIVKDE